MPDARIFLATDFYWDSSTRNKKGLGLLQINAAWNVLKQQFSNLTRVLLTEVSAPAIEAESPAWYNKKCRSSEEATKGSHRNAQAFYFTEQACSGKRGF